MDSSNRDASSAWLVIMVGDQAQSGKVAVDEI